MKYNPKISVIIPMYNSSKTIVNCLNSVVNQTYDAYYQIIVIDDGSTDDSLFIAKKYCEEHPQIHIELIIKSNGGASTARNSGLRVAKGDWIALLDSDDEWLPNKIELQMNILKDNPHIDFLGCNLLNQETKVLCRLKNNLSKVRSWELLVKIFPQTSTAIFKKDIVNDVGLYDESLRYYEDGDFWLRICMQKEFWFSPDHLVIYDGGKPNFGFSGMTANLSEMHLGNQRVLKKLYISNKINLLQYIIGTFYSQLKYYRRILIVHYRNVVMFQKGNQLFTK